MMYRQEKVIYSSKDGTRLCGIFLLPKKIKGFVLLTHGINVDKNEWDDLYVDMAKKLCDKGVASFRFDFRGHGESGGAEREMTIIGEVIDIAASVEQIKKKWTGKISIVSTSFSAGATIIYISREKNNIERVVLMCPVLDYDATFLRPTLAWARDSFNKIGYKHLSKKGFLLLDGEFEIGVKLVEEMKIIEPYAILQGTNLPVLTMHGDRDEMVPYNISKKYGKPNSKSKFLSIKDANHGFVDINDAKGSSVKTVQNKEKVVESMILWISKQEGV